MITANHQRPPACARRSWGCAILGQGSSWAQFRCHTPRRLPPVRVLQAASPHTRYTATSCSTTHASRAQHTPACVCVWRRTVQAVREEEEGTHPVAAAEPPLSEASVPAMLDFELDLGALGQRRPPAFFVTTEHTAPSLPKFKRYAAGAGAAGACRREICAGRGCATG